MSHKAFDALVQAETTAHSDLMIYIRALAHENDALSKLSKLHAKLTGDFADSKEKNADLVRSNLGLNAENTALREHVSNLRRQLYEAQLEHRNDTVTVIKREGGLDYVIAVARVEQTPGNLRVLLV